MHSFNLNDEKIFNNWVNSVYTLKIYDYVRALRLLELDLRRMSHPLNSTQFMQSAMRKLEMTPWVVNSDHFIHLLDLIKKGNPRILSEQLVKKYVPENQRDRFARLKKFIRAYLKTK